MSERNGVVKNEAIPAGGAGDGTNIGSGLEEVAVESAEANNRANGSAEVEHAVAAERAAGSQHGDEPERSGVDKIALSEDQAADGRRGKEAEKPRAEVTSVGEDVPAASGTTTPVMEMPDQAEEGSRQKATSKTESESEHKEMETPGRLSADGSPGTEAVQPKSDPVFQPLTKADKLELVNLLLARAKEKAGLGELNVGAGELIRLVQLAETLEPERPSKVTVQWVGEPEE